MVKLFDFSFDPNNENETNGFPEKYGLFGFQHRAISWIL